MSQALKPITVTVFFPSDMAVGPDRAQWYLEGAIRGWWQQFATENDSIRKMRNAVVTFPRPTARAEVRQSPASPARVTESAIRDALNSLEIAVQNWTRDLSPGGGAYKLRKVNEARAAILALFDGQQGEGGSDLGRSGSGAAGSLGTEGQR